MYYDIDESTARRSKEMCSFSDYKPGSATAEYRQMVDEAAALVESKKQAVSPFYHDKLDALLDRYARRLAQWTNDHNRNGASCPSVMICGPANFPVRKKEKRIARDNSLWQEYQEIKGILDKIKNIGTGAVDFADPHARELLVDKAERLQATLDRYKAMNAHYRKHKTMQGFPDMTDDAAAQMDKSIAGAYTWAQKPAPDYELNSLRGKIKRVQERIAEYDKLHAQQAEAPADSGAAFDGGRIVRNVEENRLQILFDEKPDEDTRSQLKSHGFRWSPRFGAWQRQLTQNAEYDARHILGIQ
jgi:hypothetical protein